MQQIPWKKIKSLEIEIKALKNINKPAKRTKKKGRDPLYGILKGKLPDLTWEDFQEAKKIWEPHNPEHKK
jgi:hypothetical protein